MEPRVLDFLPIIVKDSEQVLSCSCLGGRWYVYHCSYFGCHWAGYWFASLGALLIRLLHQFVRIKHGLMQFVEDGLFMPPTTAEMAGDSWGFGFGVGL